MEDYEIEKDNLKEIKIASEIQTILESKWTFNLIIAILQAIVSFFSLN